MSYKPTEARYRGGGEIKYLVYNSPQTLRSGRIQQRTRAQRLYFPASAKEISLGSPTTMEKRTGKQVYGVKVSYRHQLSAAKAHRGKTTYELPSRWAKREKVVELPPNAKDIHVRDRPPEGPRMAVR